MSFSSLPPEARQRSKQLYRQLLWFYVGITTAVLGLGSIVSYTYISHSLHRQHQEELKVLAEAASPSLILAKTQSEFFDPDKADTHWHELEQHSQSLEWFNQDGELLIREGKIFPTLNLSKATTLPMEGKVERDHQQNLYVVTLPVIEARDVVGIVRASESLRVIETPLQKLRWGLVLGGILAVGTIVLSGLWLAKLALQPFVQSYQRLRTFTSDASHELRGPLAIIQAGLDTLFGRVEQFGETERTTLTSINSATYQLRQLTEALLQLARMDQNIQPKKQDIPLHELLEELVDTLEAIALEQGVELTFTALCAPTIEGNNGQLVQLFTNLLQNGIQYTPDGGKVTVTLKLLGEQAVIIVADTGIGIASEDISHVFERFWRADPARSRQQGGLGLGLAIAYDIVEQHQGSIELQSQIDQGTTVEVRLPTVRS